MQPQRQTVRKDWRRGGGKEKDRILQKSEDEKNQEGFVCEKHERKEREEKKSRIRMRENVEE